MRVVLRLVVHEFRARWRGWAVLVLLVAFAGGAVLAAAAGARRTSSAYPRYLQASHASDLLVSVAGSGIGGYYAALAHEPGVALVAPGVGLNIQPVGRGGRLDLAAATEAPADGRLGVLLDIPKVLAGRLPRPGSPGEVAVDQIAAASLHVGVGSTLPDGGTARHRAARVGSFRPGALRTRTAHRAGGRHHRHPGVGRSGHRHRQGPVHPGQPRAVAPSGPALPRLRRRVRETAAGRQRGQRQPCGPGAGPPVPRDRGAGVRGR